ncbi:hypothetical protein PAPYR_9646 [Paratrimastix pyriformis]|uniref:NUDE domain-containing protein n=1 Tax=Paratrimastix pyriformis TaxID=342808 RepID=A0ABQ8UAP1_9EUKA|nr:hypothetical protein PAPYR_9646 [Paratrimastix pyriformis]
MAMGDYERLQKEFEDFQESSKDLEHQYEVSLNQSEAKAAKLEEQICRQQAEATALRATNSQLEITISSLQEENSDLQAQLVQITAMFHSLEQENDALERRGRINESTATRNLEELERAVERVALLEGELALSRTQAAEREERLRQEIQDLRADRCVGPPPTATAAGLASTYLPGAQPNTVETPLPTNTSTTPTAPSNEPPHQPPQPPADDRTGLPPSLPPRPQPPEGRTDAEALSPSWPTPPGGGKGAQGGGTPVVSPPSPSGVAATPSAEAVGESGRLRCSDLIAQAQDLECRLTRCCELLLPSLCSPPTGGPTAGNA